MRIKKVILTILFSLILILILQNKSEATLNLNSLDFDVQINSDGSMDVTETWDIYVSDTNTLFKSFEKDSSKYSNIIDVSVKEVTNGANKEFTQIYEEMYHVTKDCYYALNNSSGKFEIAWGVGLDNSSDERIYEISYKVTDAIAKYNDYAELYWQFVGEDFEVLADKVTGTILLPGYANSTDEILVWGHTEGLNGTIYATDLNEISFEIENYRGYEYIEVRSLFPTELIGNINRKYSYDIYDKVIEEEILWADEANARREAEENYIKKVVNIMVTIGCVIFGIIFIIMIINLLKNLNKIKNMEKKLTPTTEYEYYRELPYKDATPAEALFIRSECKNTSFTSSFAANILDLCLKKYISLEVIEEKSMISDGVIKITLLDKPKNNLKLDERLTLDFLEEVSEDSKELTTKDITKYLRKQPYKINFLDSDLKKIITNFEQDSGKYNVKNKIEKEKYKNQNVLSYISLFALIFVGILCIAFWRQIENKIIIMLLLICGSILMVTNSILSKIISNRINVLTQEGVDEKNKWDAFKKYMEDFSMLDQKEIPELVLWEKYLVFATAFGISEKVLKQLKVVYPQIDDINSPIYSSFAYIHIMNSIDINTCVSSSVYSGTYSSGSGAGGGFSGGGGGGRRPEAAEEVANCKIVWGRFQLSGVGSKIVWGRIQK